MPNLQWVAVLKLADGKLHTYRQPSEDPAQGFQMVLDCEKKGELVSFFLDEPRNKRSLGVNLITGQFIFSMIYNYHPAPNLAKMDLTYRLINFRRKYRDKGMGTNVDYDSGIQLAYYILGWQTTVPNYSQYVGNHQRMMFINANNLEVTIKEKR